MQIILLCRSVVQVSYNYFYMDIATAEIFTKEEDS